MLRGAGYGSEFVFYVVSCDHCNDTGVTPGGIRIDAQYARVGVWASQNGDVEYVNKLNVIYILGKSLDQAGVFPPFDPGSHGFADGHGKPPLCVHFLGGVLYGIYNVLVAGAATEVALDAASNFCLGWFGVALE